ncbi:MAG: hypothetical protein IMW94_08790 [Thermoanaerobacter sp.]|nr:hypothetical protein [Thermoanaerobacter sp.]
MASFVKTNMKIRRMSKGRIRLCRRCNMAEAIHGDLCAVCYEHSERMKRREAARRGKLRAAGGLTGKPGPWPWPEIAHQCQQIISGRRDEK